MLCHNGDGSGQKKIYSMFWHSEKKSISKKCGTFPLSCTLATAETCDRIPHVELRQTHSNPFFFLFLNKSLFPHSSLYLLFFSFPTTLILFFLSFLTLLYLHFPLSSLPFFFLSFTITLLFSQLSTLPYLYSLFNLFQTL